MQSPLEVVVPNSNDEIKLGGERAGVQHTSNDLNVSPGGEQRTTEKT